MGWRIPYCDECKAEDIEQVILLDEIWLSICSERKQIFCLSCMEKRLGRYIRREDLKPCAITRQIQIGLQIADNEKRKDIYIQARSWDTDLLIDIWFHRDNIKFDINGIYKCLIDGKRYYVIEDGQIKRDGSHDF